MEQKIVAFFDQVTMSESCAARIRGAMAAQSAPQPRKEEYTMRQTEVNRRFGWVGAAACLLLVLLAGAWVLPRGTSPENPATTPTETAETAAIPYEIREDGTVLLTVDRYVDITALLSETQPVIYCYEPEDGMIHYYALGLSGPKGSIGWYFCEYDRESKTLSARMDHCVDDSGAEYSWYTAALEKRAEQVMSVESGRAWLNTTSGGKLSGSTEPFWLREEDGRLYFTGDGQKIDITDIISEESPFLYTWEDVKGKATCFAVGRAAAHPTTGTTRRRITTSGTKKQRSISAGPGAETPAASPGDSKTDKPTYGYDHRSVLHYAFPVPQIAVYWGVLS